VEFDNNPDWPVINGKGYADKPDSHMLSGQIGWASVFDSINGGIVFLMGSQVHYYILKPQIKKRPKNRRRREVIILRIVKKERNRGNQSST